MHDIGDDEDGVEIAGEQFGHHEELGDGIVGFDITETSCGKGSRTEIEKGDEILNWISCIEYAAECGFLDTVEAVEIDRKGKYDQCDIKGYKRSEFCEYKFFVRGFPDPDKSEIDKITCLQEPGNDQYGFIQDAATFIVPVEQEDKDAYQDNDAIFICDLYTQHW